MNENQMKTFLLEALRTKDPLQMEFPLPPTTQRETPISPNQEKQAVQLDFLMPLLSS